MDRLKLKVSPKGQITLPKNVRQKLSIGDYVYLHVDRDKAVLEPVSFINEFDDLILRDIKQDGYTGEEAAVKVRERKGLLLKALEQELKESIAEAETDWENGDTVKLWPREK
jgi:AbrB family looped-hinge helix DNA binding protein